MGYLPSPPWLGPPQGSLPGTVGFERVLARNDKLAVWCDRFAAYPTGFEFDLLTIWTADAATEDADFLFFQPRPLRRGATDEIPP